MFRRNFKIAYYSLAGLNTIAAAYYFNYLFFYMQQHFHFTSAGNLALGALHGLIYIPSSRFGGNFAQRRGYFTALNTGYGIMLAVLLIGSLFPVLICQVAVFAVWTFGICFTWPTLEALISEREPRSNLPTMVGIYNLVWAGTGALSFFGGGALFEKLGTHSLYFVPAAIYVLQIGVVLVLKRKAAALHTEPPANNAAVESAAPPAPGYHGPIPPETFLKMAWIANPFAYMAINAVLPVIPDLARKLGLSPMYAGFFCSVWMFARLASFFALWLWPGWHYRFHLLASAMAFLILGFATMLLARSMWLILAAQIVFGLATGLIYYSSLFYAMDVGEKKGEHGGLHEAAIGMGIFSGAAVGAASQHFFPERAGSSTVAVSVLLLIGLAWLLWLRFRKT